MHAKADLPTACVAHVRAPTYPDPGRPKVKKIVRARAVGAFRVELRFDDGVEGTADLSDLAGSGIFASWSAEGEFEKVAIGSGGELVWPCGVDLCADALYLRMTGKSPADLFPSLGDAKAPRA